MNSMLNDPNWRAGTFFGSLSAVELRQHLLTFSPQIDGLKENNLYLKGILSRHPGSLERLLDGFSALIQDSSMTFREKADNYMEWAIDEETAAAYFRELWEQLADSRPFPLDVERSPDSPPKTKQ